LPTPAPDLPPLRQQIQSQNGGGQTCAIHHARWLVVLVTARRLFS
jgi:hypothetical protein